MLKYKNNINKFQENIIPLHLTLSSPAPNSILLINKKGHKFVLLWNKEKVQTKFVVTNEIPGDIFEYIKFLTKKIHEYNIKIEGYFHIGSCYTIIKTPYIYKLTLIISKKEKGTLYPKIIYDNTQKIGNTTVIEKKIIIEKENETLEYLYLLVETLYYNNYKPHLKIIEDYISKDIVYNIIFKYLLIIYI